MPPAPAPAPTPAPAPAPMGATPTMTGTPAAAPTAAPAAAPKKKSKIGLIIGIIAGVLILGGIIALIAIFALGGGGEMDDIYATNVYFLKDDNGKYALFNDDGERLTEFQFGYASRFIGGTAVVGDEEDDKRGIINTDGKMTVDFDKYVFISRAGGLYEATDNSSNEYLINGKGKVVYDMNKNRLVTSSDSFAVIADEKGFQILNYQGKKVLSITENLDKNIELSDEEDGYVVITHAGTNYLLNTLSAELTYKFESGDKYEISQVSEDRKSISLQTVTDDYDEDHKYKFIVDGKEQELPSGCLAAASLYDAWYCLKKEDDDDVIYLLSNDFSHTSAKATDALYVDADNYAINKEDSDSYGVIFYKGGAKVSEVNCRRIYSYGPVSSGIYLLRTYRTYSSNSACKDVPYGDYEFYSVEGKKLFGKSFDAADTFSEDGFSYVREDGDDTKYYVINKEGEKVSDGYKYMYSRSADLHKFYYAYNDYKTTDVLSPAGKKIASTSGYSTGGKVYDDKLYIYVGNRDEDYNMSYDIYTADGAKLFISDDYPDFTDHYIEATEGDNIKYYTYGGKLIHQRKDD